jgi:iron complex outermembrane receptor protein
MKKTVFALIGILSCIVTHAQENSIKGSVFDADSHKPIVGASIHLNGREEAISDPNGNFTILSDSLGEINVIYTGYEAYKSPINDADKALNIGLHHTGNLINEIEITATSTTDKSILSQPASIAKLGLTELKRGNGLFLDDAINGNVPGVIMEKRSVSGGQEFNIRGYGNGVGSRGASNNFDGEGTKVYLNNIPLTDAEGITLLDDIDFGSIGDVEITKGPAGSLYGLAIAGVVNLNTIKPEKDRVSFGQDIMVGSYGLRRYTTHLEMGGDHSSVLVNYGRQTSDGYYDSHSASHKDFVNVIGNFQPNRKEQINYYFGYSNSYDQRAGELTIAQYNNGDYSGNPDYIKNDAHSKIISFRAGLSHVYSFNKHISNTTSVFASGVSNNSSSAAGYTDKAPINYGLRSTLDVNYDLSKGFVLSGVSGIETQSQYAQIIGYAMVPDSSNLGGYNRIGSAKSNQVIFTTTTSAFSEWSLSMPHNFSITAGLGWSSMFIKLNDRFYVANSKNPTSYAINYANMFSPHIALNKTFNKQLSLYASYSKGYKAPVSANIYIPTTGAVNTGLKPEIGNQFEIGTKGILLNSRLNYQIALFDARFSNKMTSVAVPLNSTTTAYTYTANGGTQDDKGIELSAKYSLIRSADGFVKLLSPFANFCYSYFKYDDFAFQTLDASKKTVITDYSNNRVAGVAPVTANAGIDLLTKIGLYANVNYSYRDAMPITSDDKNKTNSYSLLNSKIGMQKAFGKHLNFDVFFGANNMLGAHYYNMVFLNQLPDAYMPAPNKINYFGGVNFKYTL